MATTTSRLPMVVLQATRVPAALLCVVLITISCGDEATDPNDGGDQCLESAHPDQPVINPDDPQFEDNHFSLEEVRQLFAEAKAADSDAYRAYRAAFEYADLLQCAFCDCGCSTYADHLSAVDCFKDLHGFW